MGGKISQTHRDLQAYQIAQQTAGQIYRLPEGSPGEARCLLTGQKNLQVYPGEYYGSLEIMRFRAAIILAHKFTEAVASAIPVW